jgi:prepilin-type processing-associated H-X9-DG protein
MDHATRQPLDYQSRRPPIKSNIAAILALVLSAIFVITAVYALRYGLGRRAIVVHVSYVPCVLMGIAAPTVLIIARMTGARGQGSRRLLRAAIVLILLGAGIGSLSVCLSSYVYLGAGLTRATPDTAVLIYESVPNHEDFANVLFGDGHTESRAAQEAGTVARRVAVRAQSAARLARLTIAILKFSRIPE